MSTNEKSDIRFPDETTRETRYVANSGSEVVLTFVEANLFKVTLPAQPGYAAGLRRNGPDDFDLAPADGVIAAGGTGLELEDLMMF